MYLPVAIAILGVISYLEANEKYRDILFISATMVIYSSVLWIPYIVLITIKWRSLTTKIKTISSLPFIMMALIATYINTKNMPW